MLEQFRQLEQDGKAHLMQLILTHPANQTSSKELARMECDELEKEYDALPVADEKIRRQKMEESLDDSLFGW